MEHNIETEQDLQRLLGQFESIRLEFKASALLAQPTDRIVKQLTEEVSAFANTEGGMLIIGISEGKSGRKSVAVEIDEGVDPVQTSSWLAGGFEVALGWLCVALCGFALVFAALDPTPSRVLLRMTG